MARLSRSLTSALVFVFVFAVSCGAAAASPHAAPAAASKHSVLNRPSITTKLTRTRGGSGGIRDVISPKGPAVQLTPDIETPVTVAATATGVVAKAMRQLNADAFLPAVNKENLKLLGYILAWYAVHVIYNTKTKQVLAKVPLPYSLAAGQFLISIGYVVALWLLDLRDLPALTEHAFQRVAPTGIFHTLAHIAAVVSIGAGSVSFTHTIKAAEPLFAAIFAAFMLGKRLSIWQYAALVPIVAGVGMASIHEAQFSWQAFVGAMSSNVASALRSIYAKGLMVVDRIPPVDIFVLSIMLGFAATAPLALVLEGKQLFKVLKPGSGVLSNGVGMDVLVSGLTYFLYNELAFRALQHLHPVSHAVVNTLKRVVVILSSLAIFNTPVSSEGVLGTAIALAGVLVYSLAAHHA